MKLEKILDSLGSFSAASYVDPGNYPDKNKPCLLAFTHLLNRGGAPLVLMELLLSLKDKYNPVLISQKDGILAGEFVEKGFNVYVGTIENYYSLPGEIWQMADLAIFNSIAANDMVECFQGTSVPVIWWVHENGTFFEFYRDKLDSLSHLSYNFKILTISGDSSRDLKKYYGIDSPVFEMGLKDSYKQIDDPHDKVRFFMPSAFIEIKGIDILAAAILRLPPEYLARSEFYFAGPIVGEDYQYRNLVEKLAEAMPQTVAMLGEMTKDEVYETYALVDCVLATSRVDATPTTIVEGMMFEKVCLCSDACGISEHIQDGVNGFVFKSEDIEELVQKLEYIIDNYDELGELRANGRNLFLSKYDSRISTSRFLGFIDELRADIQEKELQNDFAISVVIPCYNIEKYISRCLDSILTQTIGLSKIQIIAVNDASTDSTADVLMCYENKFPDNIMVINCETSNGSGGARNIGLSYATGKYVFYIDGDDCIRENTFEEMYDLAERTGCDFVECGYSNFSGEPETDAWEVSDLSQLRIYTTAARKETLVRSADRTAPWGRLFKRTFLVWNNIFFPEKLLYQDIFFTELCFMYVSNIVYINEPLYLYFQNDKGETWDKTNFSRLTEKIDVQEMLMDVLRDRKLVDECFLPFREEIAYVAARKLVVDSLSAMVSAKVEDFETMGKITDYYNSLFDDADRNEYIKRDEMTGSVLALAGSRETFGEFFDLPKETPPEEKEAEDTTKALLGRIKTALRGNKELCKIYSAEDIGTCLMAEVGYREQGIAPDAVKEFDSRIGLMTIELKNCLEQEKVHEACLVLDKMISFLDELPAVEDIAAQNYDDAYEKHRTEGTIVVIGDSHVNFFSGNEGLTFNSIGHDVNICPQINGFPFTALHLGACLAYTSNHYGTSEGFLEKLDWLLKGFIMPGDKVVVSLGEIDIRCHVFIQTEKQNKSYEEIVDGILDNYFDMLIYLQEHGAKVYVWGPIATQKDDVPLGEYLPRVGGEVERNLATRYFNTEAMKRCEENGMVFMSVFEKMVGEDMRTRPEFVAEDKCHLAQRVFEVAVNEWERVGLI